MYARGGEKGGPEGGGQEEGGAHFNTRPPGEAPQPPSSPNTPPPPPHFIMAHAVIARPPTNLPLLIYDRPSHRLARALTLHYSRPRPFPAPLPADRPRNPPTRSSRNGSSCRKVCCTRNFYYTSAPHIFWVFIFFFHLKLSLIITIIIMISISVCGGGVEGVGGVRGCRGPCSTQWVRVDVGQRPLTAPRLAGHRGQDSPGSATQ